MDYHLEGYQPGNPRNRSPHPGRTLPEQLPATADVLIVGCGPAGLMLGAQLAQFADLSTVIIDQKHGPLEVGQADGISGRSLEIFDAFGFSNRVLEEAYQLRAISFWRHDAKEPTQIKRHEKRADGRSQFSHFPHVVLNQAWKQWPTDPQVCCPTTASVSSHWLSSPKITIQSKRSYSAPRPTGFASRALRLDTWWAVMEHTVG